jgi:beta-lactam-binding protein with PASTA domain
MKIHALVLLLVTCGLASALAASASAAPMAKDKFKMPNVVGMVLQDAQDVLQSQDSYVLDQKDALGLGRFQLFDSGWKVCRQSPRAGKTTSTSAMITLWSVKLRERCPR